MINGWGLKAYTWAIWARTLIGTAAMLYLVPFWPGVNFSLASLRCSLQFGVKFQFNDLLSRLKDQFFYLFIAMQLPPEQFGLISFSKNWSMYPYNLTVQNIMAITFPTFSRLQDNLRVFGVPRRKPMVKRTMGRQKRPAHLKKGSVRWWRWRRW